MNKELENWKSNGKYLRFKDNNIFYGQDGEGDNLLIIHGYPYNSFEWKETIAELSKTFKVTFFDLLGMGFSDKPRNHKYSFEEYCDIVNALLLNLNIQETHIFSHDLGVSVAQELIARNAESKNNFKIKSTAFMNGSLFIDVYKPRLIQKLLSKSPTLIGKTLSKVMSKSMVNKSVKSVFGPFTQPSEAFLDQQWEILNFNNGKEIAYLIGRLVFDKYNYLSRWVHAMQTTSIPMCYICGPFDPNSGIHMANRYKELIPNPNVYLLEKYIGHWPQLEDIDNVIKYYYEFIKGLKE
ncbi:MAG: alpha/beta hydrolase [Flavobacteriales bacterium]|nr:alpha/beta hydrolase [Flavobacteriales bacterium]